ncbi:MAG: 3-deoxy-8-phosphooctulonate synthase [Planctomycetes bacterium]|nr:3-deoxy-8-phosphooctulonate synthase [Planctomycetota bacterium]
MRLRTTFQLPGRELRAPLYFIGPDVIESRDGTLEIADRLARIARARGLSLVFKASYEKANRSSADSYRGPGIDEGLSVLAEVKERFDLPVMSDVHGIEQVAAAARVLDVIQIPAFLSRQNALLEAVARCGRAVNLKKGQFLSPWDVPSRVDVLRSAGASEVLITERGVSFGYQRLINDFRVVPVTQATGAGLIFDATHSVQTPGGAAGHSGGERPFIPVLARAAAAAGADGFFFEVHPDPSRALCDGPNALPLDTLEPLLDQLEPLTRLVRELPDLELE